MNLTKISELHNISADYLVIDRTAMMKQLKKMQDEKIITKNKNKITLLKEGFTNK